MYPAPLFQLILLLVQFIPKFQRSLPPATAVSPLHLYFRVSLASWTKDARAVSRVIVTQVNPVGGRGDTIQLTLRQLCPFNITVAITASHTDLGVKTICEWDIDITDLAVRGY